MTLQPGTVLNAAENENVPVAVEEFDKIEAPIGGGLESHPTSPFDPEPERERVRTYVAFGLVGTLASTTFMAFVLLIVIAIWGDSTEPRSLTTEDLKSVLSIIYPALIGVVGTTLGFYYAGKR